MSTESNSCSNHSAENGSSVHHVVQIDESFLSEVEGKMQELPRLLNRSAGRDSCCIFRVPQSPLEINKKAYQPHVVSIGPFHHGEPHFQMIQGHKWRFLSDLLLWAESKRVVLKDFFEAVALMEEQIRKSYLETLEFDGQDLIRMMVLDGCFIIELFCKVGRIVPADLNDPLFTMAWVLPFLMRDLLRLENQIPYFVLQKLFDLFVGSGNDGPSLAKLALGFFNYMVQRPVHVLEKYYVKEGMHLLDLFRMSYISDCQKEVRRPSRFLHQIQCAKKLDQAGVQFKPRKTHSILDIKFKNGILEIPVLTIDDFWSSLFLNFVACEQCYRHSTKPDQAGVQFKPRKTHSISDIKFKNDILEIPVLTIDDFWSSLFLNFVACEQCYRHSTKYITTYATLMGCLINTPADPGFLGDHKIIENYFGTDEEVARFFDNVGKDVVFDIHRSYLSKVFEEVNEYCQNDWHIRWAGFRHTYFDTPWSFMSAVAAVVLLLLTMIQSFYAIYQYHRPPKNH